MGVYEDFKRIRNKLRKFDAEPIVVRLMERLHAIRDMPIEEIAKTPPWLLLLLLKWTLQHSKFNPRLKRASEDDVRKLINALHELSGNVRMPTEYSNVFVFVKNMAFQQFWLQQRLTSAFYGRQVLMFEQDKSATLYSAMLQKHLGLTVAETLDLSLTVLTRYLSEHGIRFHRSYFAPVEKHYRAGAMEKLLAQLALTPGEVPDYLRIEDERVKSFDASLYLPSPLRRRPLLRVGDEFFCYSPNVLVSRVGTLVYDLLKELEGNAFTGLFGNTFERYVGHGLLQIGGQVISENEMKVFWPGSKVLDYLLPLKDANILIDAKAVEMKPLGQVTPDADVVRSELKSSVVKAVIQGLRVAKNLRDQPPSVVANPRAEPFLLIITMKPLFIGNGKLLLFGDATEEISRAAAEEGVEVSLIPAENIYVLSIEEFEWLVAHFGGKRDEIAAMLSRAVADDSNPPTSKLQFGQHLQSQFGTLPIPKFAAEPFEKRTDELIVKMGGDPSKIRRQRSVRNPSA